ncbi:CsbD family protein [Lichenibacterium minor]|uniref:CsbD family protein n=1 Tax=Lichenibacterium minor TaxID=2316528 RepID=A0A4Q2U6C4_9HYPH|nr:CsbD family protein [Lichenibacterium minor]RYC30416.1 CsbD family protein [Lichenibacterium minor]
MMDMDRLKGGAQEVGGKIQEVAGRLTGDHGTQAEGVVREVAGAAQNLYGQAKDGVRDATGAVSDYAERAYGQGRRVVSRGSHTIADEVGEHPLTALLVAGTVGYLLALLVNARR